MDKKEQLKEKAEELIKKIRDDKDFSRKFMENPVKTVEDTLGVDLPEEQIQGIIDKVKSELAAKSISDVAGTLGIGNLGNLFGGKKSS